MTYKVKSFGTEIRPLKAAQELRQLDDSVNRFLSDGGSKKLISVSDMATTDNTGETIGIVRLVAYEE
jgi:hypothetical protein